MILCLNDTYSKVVIGWYWRWLGDRLAMSAFVRSCKSKVWWHFMQHVHVNLYVHCQAGAVCAMLSLTVLIHISLVVLSCLCHTPLTLISIYNSAASNIHVNHYGHSLHLIAALQPFCHYGDQPILLIYCLLSFYRSSLIFPHLFVWWQAVFFVNQV